MAVQALGPADRCSRPRPACRDDGRGSSGCPLGCADSRRYGPADRLLDTEGIRRSAHLADPAKRRAGAGSRWAERRRGDADGRRPGRRRSPPSSARSTSATLPRTSTAHRCSTGPSVRPPSAARASGSATSTPTSCCSATSSRPSGACPPGRCSGSASAGTATSPSRWSSTAPTSSSPPGRGHGTLDLGSGSDYFVFPRTTDFGIPSFAVGRPGWDNWMMGRRSSWASR